jgi:hypothetical protein
LKFQPDLVLRSSARSERKERLGVCPRRLRVKAVPLPRRKRIAREGTARSIRNRFAGTCRIWMPGVRLNCAIIPALSIPAKIQDALFTPAGST